MSSINKVILVGSVGKEPEIKTTNFGKIASFSLATSESWKDKNTGEKKEKTEWHNVSVMNESLANVVERYVTKGSKLYIEGKLQTEKYTGKDGVEKYTTKVVLSGYGGQIVMLNKVEKQDTESSAHYKAKKDGYAPDDDLEDEVPF